MPTHTIEQITPSKGDPYARALHHAQVNREEQAQTTPSTPKTDDEAENEAKEELIGEIQPLDPQYKALPLNPRNSAGMLTKEAHILIHLDLVYVKNLSVAQRESLASELEVGQTAPRRTARLDSGAPARRGRPIGSINLVASHWGVALNTVRRTEEKLHKHGRFSPLKRSGRPRRRKDLETVIVKVYNDAFGTRSIRALALDVAKLLVDWDTQYNGRTLSAPSKSTIQRTPKDMVESGNFTIRSLHKRAPINESTRLQRLEICTKRLDEGTVARQYDVDEAYIQISDRELTMIFPTDEPIPEAQLAVFDASHNHPPKGAYGYRCYKKNGPVVNGVRAYNKGDIKWENVNIDGPLYNYLLTMQNGVFDAIDSYEKCEEWDGSMACVLAVDLDDFERCRQDWVNGNYPCRQIGDFDGKMVLFQEDGAPGHGYNNRHGGKPTAAHNLLSERAFDRDIYVTKQPKNSPECNMLDLGVWHIIKAHVQNNFARIPVYDEVKKANAVEAAIWELCKEAWETVTARKLFNIAMQKVVVFKKIVENNGGALPLEPHEGIRTMFGTHKSPE